MYPVNPRVLATSQGGRPAKMGALSLPRGHACNLGPSKIHAAGQTPLIPHAAAAKLEKLIKQYGCGVCCGLTEILRNVDKVADVLVRHRRRPRCVVY